MLADPRSEALVTNFGQQLLYLRNLPATSPDGVFYPDWDDELRAELPARVGAVLREHHARGPQRRRSADRRLHVRQRAAGAALRHPEHLRIAVPARARSGRSWTTGAGCSGKGSFLAVTWTQNFRTSPVKRGVWVLENILGTPPPEPPPNVPGARGHEGGRAARSLTLREQMTLHRANRAVRRLPQASWTRSASRSRTSTPTASWRTQAGRRRRHADRRGGRRCSTASRSTARSGCGRRCCATRRSSCGCSIEKMMTYALGRGVEYTDMPAIRAIVRDAAKDDQPVLGDRAGRREERAVPDANEGRRDRSGLGRGEPGGARLMFITKKHMPRRTFLRGAGVTLALPLLESMVPALTPLRLTAAAPVRRFVGIWHPHGACARLLESAPGGQGLRVLVHHQAAGAVPQSRRADHRPRHAGGDGDRPTSRAATTRAARCCCRARGRGATRSARTSASRSIS